jgi:hypothetical protein
MTVNIESVVSLRGFLIRAVGGLRIGKGQRNTRRNPAQMPLFPQIPIYLGLNPL